MNRSRWKNSTILSWEVHTGINSACHAIRRAHQMNLLKSDPFILLSSDVISNIDLKPIIQKHKDRRKSKDQGQHKNTMTTVFIKSNQSINRLRPLDESLEIILDPNTKQILKYKNRSPDRKKTSIINPSMFHNHLVLEHRYDLLDCHIDICSPEMVHQLLENYDYKDLRKDYINNETQNLDLDLRIHAFEVVSPLEYACRIRCFRTYAAVSKDILQNWLHPLIPVINWFPRNSYYFHDDYSKYIDINANVNSFAEIGNNTMISSGCIIKANSKIYNSIIGNGCHIDEGVLIQNSIIWKNVKIKSGAKISYAVLCDDVFVDENAVVTRGCVLSYGVKIGKGFHTTEFDRITVVKNDEMKFRQSFDESSSNINHNQMVISGQKEEKTSKALTDTNYDETIVGIEGKGIRYLLNSTVIPKWAEEFIKNYSFQSFSQIGSSMGCIELEQLRQHCCLTPQSSVIYEESDDDLDSRYEQDNELLDFCEEIVNSINENFDHENILLELNAQKFAQDRSFSDIIYAMVPFILKKGVNNATSKEEAKKLSIYELNRWTPVLNSLIQSEIEEVVLIRSIELLAFYGENHAALTGLNFESNKNNLENLTKSDAAKYFRLAFPYILFHLCMKEIVSPDSIIEWSNSHETSGIEDTLLMNHATQLILNQLLKSNSEEEESTDDNPSVE